MTSPFDEEFARVRAAHEDGEDDKALRLARQLATEMRTAGVPAEAAWKLSELLLEMGEESLGLEISAQQATIGKGDESIVRHARLLHLAGREGEAVETLQSAAVSEASPVITGALIELALSGAGWRVLDPLRVVDRDARRMVREARRRAEGLGPQGLDSRRLAYVLSRVVELGASEDEGDEVAPYWFMNLDEHEAAWLVRRFHAWVVAEGIDLTTVRAGDRGARPLALALADRLGLPFRQDPAAAAGCLCVLSALGRLVDAGAPDRNDRLVFCVGVRDWPGWHQLLFSSPVDVVGLFAPLELSWSTESEAGVASAILREERRLPEDQALPSILRFYKKHLERVR